MTRQQTTILWLGLILVGLNLVVHIGSVKAVIFGGGSSSAAAPPPNPPLAPGPLPIPPITGPNTSTQQTPPGIVTT